MGRKLKFRVWSKKLSKYGIKDCDICDWSHTVGDLPDDSEGTVLHENYAVEQYVGIDDMNGKEIYEGDVVGYDVYEWTADDKPVFSNYGIVTWSKAFSGYQFNLMNFDGTLGGDGFYGGLPNCGEFVIVGNIHENPELLTQLIEQ